jgi:hypothetical protein
VARRSNHCFPCGRLPDGQSGGFHSPHKAPGSILGFDSLWARLAWGETAVLGLGEVVNSLIRLPLIILLKQGQTLGTRQNVSGPSQTSRLFQALIKRHRFLKNQRVGAAQAQGPREISAGSQRELPPYRSIFRTPMLISARSGRKRTVGDGTVVQATRRSIPDQECRYAGRKGAQAVENDDRFGREEDEEPTRQSDKRR